jgi:signal transduction histidine kinase
VTPEIQISAQRDGAYWRLSVKDNGIGFDMSHVDKLFKPFYRVPVSEDYAGAGLGLAICHDVIRQIGGQIWACSAPGKGSTFFFSVRAIPEDSGRDLIS